MELEKIPSANALDGAEMFRLLAKTGGLWSPQQLAAACGDRVRMWPDATDFPKPAWKVGRTNLYAGWEVWLWMEKRQRLDAANALKEKLMAMRRMNRRDVS